MNNDDGPGGAQVDPPTVETDTDTDRAADPNLDETTVEPAGLFPLRTETPGAGSLFPARDAPLAGPLFAASEQSATGSLFTDPKQGIAAAAVTTNDPELDTASASDPAPIAEAATGTGTGVGRGSEASASITAPVPGARADPLPDIDRAPAAPASGPAPEADRVQAPLPLPAASLVRGPDRPPTPALSWVDVARVGTGSASTAAASSRALLDDAPRRSLARPAVLLPLAGVLAVTVAYGATTALWPLHAVQPVASAVKFQPAAAPAAATAWPGMGSAAVSVEGIGTVASAEQQAPMASITKLVTVLASLDKLPLQPGEQGPSFAFTQTDGDDYWNYLRQDQSALDVPIGGSLTQYQLYEGILLGSANNYADRLAREVWGSEENFAAAANQWLSQHDLGDIRVVTPSGFDFGNVTTPGALVRLGEIAEKNPVVSAIVKQKSVELPGAGIVENTNGLINDAGIIGIKTGTIGDGDDTRYNLLSAKDVTEGATDVRIFVAALGQNSDQARVDASRALYAGVEAALKDQPQTVGKGTVLATVDTAWGETTEIVAAEDARVVLWNGASAKASTKLALGDEWKAGEKAGTLSLKGPLDAATVPLELRTALDGPSLWWRLTHPLELFGVTK